MNQYTVYHLIQFFWAIMESKINRWVYVLIQKFQSGFWHIYWINSGTTENFEIKEDFFVFIISLVSDTEKPSQI